jgi:hypothetical protein
VPKAGQIIRAADFDGFAWDADSADELNFNSTSFTLGSTTVGTAFVAPTSGSVVINWGARANLNINTALQIRVSAEVRTGSTVGSGTVVAAANDGWAIEVGQSTNNRLGTNRARPVTGLTPGATYNVSLWHKNAASVVGGSQAGSIFDRDVFVVPVV